MSAVHTATFATEGKGLLLHRKLYAAQSSNQWMEPPDLNRSFSPVSMGEIAYGSDREWDLLRMNTMSDSRRCMVVQQMLQNAMFYCILSSMSAVRISKQLAAAAKVEARAMHRSIAGQIEHWADLGRALEALGLSAEELKALRYRARIARDDPMVRLIKQAGPARVVEVSASDLMKAKHIRQNIDHAAQRDGLVNWKQMSPFADADLKAELREVPLD